MTDTDTDKSFQIDPWHQIAFDAINGNNDAIGLVACRISDEPSACICLGRTIPGGGMQIMPLFVAITPGLDMVFPNERASSGGGGGGPKRTVANVARAFAINKPTVTHG